MVVLRVVVDEGLLAALDRAAVDFEGNRSLAVRSLLREALKAYPSVAEVAAEAGRLAEVARREKARMVDGSASDALVGVPPHRVEEIRAAKIERMRKAKGLG